MIIDDLKTRDILTPGILLNYDQDLETSNFTLIALFSSTYGFPREVSLSPADPDINVQLYYQTCKGLYIDTKEKFFTLCFRETMLSVHAPCKP